MILSLVHGSMFSGKTSRILKSIGLCKRYSLDFHVILPVFDNRHEIGNIVSHDNELYKGKEVLVFGKDPLPRNSKAKMIFIDEVQFFAPDEIDKIIKTFKNTAHFITFYGLLYDYAGEKFPTSEYVLKLSDISEEMEGICAVCGEAGFKTQRLVGGKPAPVGEKILIGGSGTYECRCENCYVHPKEAEEFWTY